MPDLATMLRAHVEAKAAPIDVDALVDDLLAGRVPSPPPRRRVRGPAIAVAAAAVLLVLIGAAALWLGGRVDEGPVVTTVPPTQTIAPSPALELDFEIPLEEASGRAALDVDRTAEAVMWDVARFGSRYVAVGEWALSTAHGGSGLPGAAVWTSEDGASWTRRVFSGSHLTAVTVFRDELIAVGRDGVWMSPDGADWAKVTDEADGPHGFVDLAAGSKGVIAAGRSEDGADDPGLASVWHSQDGRSWTVTTLAPDPWTGALGALAHEDGFLIVGGTCPDRGLPNPETDCGARLWSSADGTAWTQIAHDESLFGDGFAYDVAAIGDALVVVGSDGRGQSAAAWVSTDGVSWSRVTEGLMTAAPPLHTVRRIAGRLVAVSGDAEEPALWTSTNGTEWAAVDTPAGFFAGGLLAALCDGPGGLVAVGGGAPGALVWRSDDGARWTEIADSAPPPVSPPTRDEETAAAAIGWRRVSPAAELFGEGWAGELINVDERLVLLWNEAIGEDRFRPSIWTSPDGVAWTRSSSADALFDPGAGTVWVDAIASGGHRMAAVGAVGSEFPVRDPATMQPAVWLSDDGVDWNRAELPDDAFPPLAMPHGVAISADGTIVVVGAEEASPDEVDESDPASWWPTGAIWTSPDGRVWSRVETAPGVLDATSLGIVRATPAGFVASGFDASATGSAPLLWHSPDGTDWERLDLDEETFPSFASEIFQIEALGGKVLLLGRYGASEFEPAENAMWESSDGRSWRRVALDPELLADVQLTDAARVGGALVVVGISYEPRTSNAAVWLSPDGSSWRRLPPSDSMFGDAVMWSAQTLREALVVVGSDVWIWQPDL